MWRELIDLLETEDPVEPSRPVASPDYLFIFESFPKPSDQNEPNIENRAKKHASDIGIDPLVDRYQIGNLEHNIMGSYKFPKSPDYSEDRIVIDREFAENCREEELNEVVTHEIIHGYQRNHSTPTGTLLDQESNYELPEPVVEEMNYADELYDIVVDDQYSEELSEAARNGLEARTQWITEAITGSEGTGYTHLSQQMDKYMQQRYGIAKTDITKQEREQISATNQKPWTPEYLSKKQKQGQKLYNRVDDFCNSEEPTTEIFS